MTSGNWTTILKQIGKLALRYDTATTYATNQETNRAATLDQWADGSGTSGSLEITDILASLQSTWSSAVGSGPTSDQAATLNAATRFFKTTYFKSKFEHFEPGNTLDSILSAWQQEQETDSKSFTTRGSTGIVHFLDQLVTLSETFDWNQSGSPTHADGTYCVSGVI